MSKEMDKSTSNEQTLHWLLGGALLLIALFAIIMLVLVKSKAEDIGGSVGNEAPTVSEVFVNDSNWTFSDSNSGTVTVPLNSTKTIHINGVVADPNGQADINAIKVIFRRDAASNCDLSDSGTEDTNNCYYRTVGAGDNGGCSLRTAGDRTYATGATEVEFTCPFTNISYIADATDAGSYYGHADGESDHWTVAVKIIDNDAASSGWVDSDTGLGANNASYEVATVLALNFGSSISFGEMALGAVTGATDVPYTITQYGNQKGDLDISMAAGLSCDLGGLGLTLNSATVDPGYTNGAPRFRFSTSSDAYADVTGSWRGVSSSAKPAGLVVGRSEGGAVTDTLYWHTKIPDYGVKGTCAGTITIDQAAVTEYSS